MSPQVRPMREADIEAAAAVQAEAFRSNAADMAQNYREGARSTWRDGWVVEADAEIGAAAIAIPATWWFAGTPYPASAIAAVGVRATDRRRGFASLMMRAILEADHQIGRVWSLLYPFQHGFYRRVGYATVGFTHFYRLPLRQLPDDPTLRRKVRMLRPTDRQPVYEVHRQSLTSAAGGFERNAPFWDKLWSKPEQRWVVYDDGRVQGYLSYEPIERQLNVVELVALTPEAERGLWGFLAAQVEQSSVVSYHAPIDKPLWATLREPLMFEPAYRGFVLKDVAHLTAGLMARIVDLEAAFEARRFPLEAQGALVLALRDPVLDANTGTFTISFNSGQAHVSPGGNARASCDIVTLSQLFCGVLSARAARWSGLLEADDGSVALLDRAFGGPTPFVHSNDWF